MKRLTHLLLTLLLALGTGQAAYAQLGVRTSTDDVKYEYYITRHAGNKRVQATVGTEQTSMGFSGGTEVKFIFKTAPNTTDGYTMYATNIIKDESGNFVETPVCISTPTATPAYYIKSGTAAEFKFVPVVCTNDSKYALQLQLNRASGGATINTLNTWGWVSDTLKYQIGNQKGEYKLWGFEAAAPAPFTFSSYTTGALATYSTAIAATIPTDVKAYTVRGLEDNGTTLTLAEITDGIIPAGVGVLLENKSLEAAYYPTEASSAGTATSNKLTPTTSATAVEYTSDVYNSGAYTTSATGSITVAADGDNATSYVLADPTGGDGVGFYPLDESSRTISAYKAYLTLTKGSSTEGSSSNSLKLQFPDGTTGIMHVDGTITKDAPVYDLTGRRVAKQTKGNLYISNGKKFIAQ